MNLRASIAHRLDKERSSRLTSKQAATLHEVASRYGYDKEVGSTTWSRPDRLIAGAANAPPRMDANFTHRAVGNRLTKDVWRA